MGLLNRLRRDNIAGSIKRYAVLACLAAASTACLSQQAAGAASSSTTSSTSTTAAANNLPAASAVFPANVYPLPTSTVGNGTNAACPSLEGVQTAVTPSVSTLVDILNQFNSASSAEQAKLLADRAAWSYIAPSDSSQGSYPAVAVDQTYLVPPGSLGSAPQPITASCSPAVMSASWFLEICTQGGPFAACDQEHPALVGTAGFVQRDGHWLIWFLS